MSKRRVHIFQPQYSSAGRDGFQQYWLPYSAGCLWAYAQSHDDIRNTWQLEKLHYRRLPIEQVLESMTPPDLCAFSCYAWNENYNLALAQAIRQRWPHCRIVFGGPQSSAHMLQYKFIDTIVLSEGEVSFVDILRRITAGQELESLMTKRRLDDLDIPSPYLLGLFDPVIDSEPPGTLWETVIETNRGCPYQCTFCDWGGLTYSKVRKFTMERIEAEIKWIARKPVAVVMLADANFGIFKQRDMEIARMINRHWSGSQVEYINITFTKMSNESIYEITRTLGPMAKSVTLSMQSLNQATLKAIKRENMKSNDLANMLALSRKYAVPTYTDMILGLPEETLESWKQGLMKLIELGQDGFIDTNFTNMLVNTELNQIQRQLYKIKTVKVENYQIDPESDAAGIKENTELVSATNTMTVDDMVDAWMWHWLIQFFHTSGYSHVASRFAYNVHGVPFLQFYQTLFDLTRDDSGAVGAEFARIRRAAHSLLTKGDIGDEIRNVYDFYIASYTVFYSNLESVLDLVEMAVKQVCTVDGTVMNLQRHAVFNDRYPPGQTIICNYDIETWVPKSISYRVVSNLAKFSGTYEEFQRGRRGTVWKNRFESAVA